VAKLPNTLDFDYIHSEDISDLGPALNAVRYVRVDEGAVRRRNDALIQERIAARVRGELERLGL
jgi:hypothetical protein